MIRRTCNGHRAVSLLPNHSGPANAAAPYDERFVARYVKYSRLLCGFVFFVGVTWLGATFFGLINFIISAPYLFLKAKKINSSNKNICIDNDM